LNDETRAKFKVACKLQGATLAGELYHPVISVIRQEEERNSEKFKEDRLLAGLLLSITEEHAIMRH
jgi:hypothetical protein